MTDQGSIHRAARRLTAAGEEALDEIVAQEVAVALVYNGISHAVMMATPCDLEDFARGFSLTEHIVEKPSEIYYIEVEEMERSTGGRGFEVRLDIASKRMVSLQTRRRSMSGRTGCGLCGAETAADAIRECASVPGGVSVSAAEVHAAIAQLASRQPLNARTGSVHAAAWVVPGAGIQVVREDVGRHNALDKTIGALARAHADFAAGYMLIYDGVPQRRHAPLRTLREAGTRSGGASRSNGRSVRGAMERPPPS